MESYESVRNRSKEWNEKIAGKILVSQEIVEAKSFPGLAENEISELDLPKPKRIIFPGCMVTCDFRPERLNVTCEEQQTGKAIIKSAHFG
ncbi:uncharacterized protein SAPINGB_P006310 [Magnusiomyces paraingens]|uniref:Uncharacterized protein n=1 Tax=Magnusiomyces paraingens TaxID=2606893 RepID=A0A5E8C6G8_9ASCO|nr:uncharacterized protein SAPINGB_P006310 [Saprochaete ingens]VVT58640.1 unnamed protein product [Saprochaete ingens]